MQSRILFISGRHEDARHLSNMLHALPLKLEHVPSLEHARIRLRLQEYEVIVTDPQADAHFWAEALNLGAYDLLAQPFYEPEVRRILYNACSRPPSQSSRTAAS